jgi:hypothetical protein
MALSFSTWTIKHVAVETRRAANRAAAQDGTVMGQWIAKAVERQAAFQDNIEVIPPESPASPARITGQTSSGLQLGTAAELIAAMAQAATSGLPVTKSAVRDVLALVRADIRLARGLAASKPRKPIRHTASQDANIAVIEHENGEGGPGIESGATIGSDESTE